MTSACPEIVEGPNPCFRTLLGNNTLVRIVPLILALNCLPLAAMSFGSATNMQPAGDNNEFLIVTFDRNDQKRDALRAVRNVAPPGDLGVYAYPESGVYRNDGSLQPIWVDRDGVLHRRLARTVHLSRDGRTASFVDSNRGMGCLFVYRDGLEVARHMLDKPSHAQSPTFGYASTTFLWTSWSSAGVTYVRWIREAGVYQFSTETGQLLRVAVRAELAQLDVVARGDDSDGDGIPQDVDIDGAHPAVPCGCAMGASHGTVPLSLMCLLLLLCWAPRRRATHLTPSFVSLRTMQRNAIQPRLAINRP